MSQQMLDFERARASIMELNTRSQIHNEFPAELLDLSLELDESYIPVDMSYFPDKLENTKNGLDFDFRDDDVSSERHKA